MSTPHHTYRQIRTIHAPASACYQRWRDFEEMPGIFHNVKGVYHLGEDVWRWDLRDREGGVTSLDLLLLKDIPDRLLVWRTLAGPELDMTTVVTFDALSPDETQVTVEVTTVPAEGVMGTVMNDLFSVPERAVRLGLDEFKQTMEALAVADEQTHSKYTLSN